MKYLYDQPHDHQYIYIRTESIPLPHVPGIVEKEVYACLDCGLGMDIFKMDSIIRTDKEKTE